MNVVRPDPDALLRQIETQEAGESRGRLKIFLGYAPRVGKSVRMFDEGRRRLKRGQDVVVGAVQSRSPDDHSELVQGFEVLATGTDGAVDVPALLARKPEVCLIDELARGNPPGSVRAHRWEDALELTANGINVVGAINLQHIAEEQDAVERITGKRAAHSVPLSFVQAADEIVIVDIPAADLARHGGALPGSRLTAVQISELRELALLVAAQVVEDQLQRHMDSHGIQQSWGTQERILVCLTPGGNAKPMLESAARATQRFHGQLLAVTVRQPDMTRPEEETLEGYLDYARRLGAEVHVIEGRDPVGAIIAFAREHRITQLFAGHTRQPRWRFWAANNADRLIRASEGMDVRLFPHGARP